MCTVLVVLFHSCIFIQLVDAPKVLAGGGLGVCHIYIVYIAIRKLSVDNRQ